MSRRNSALSIFLAAVLALPATHTWAQAAKSAEPIPFRVGLKSLQIPPPSNEFVETGSDYRVLLEPLAPASNRLVAAFLLPEELKSIQTSKTPLTRYALVEVPRVVEFMDVNPDSLKQIADSVASQFGGSTETLVKNMQEEVNSKLKALNETSATVTLDKPVFLGTFFAKADAYCFGLILPVQVNGKTTKLAMTITVFRIQDRVLCAYLTTPYVDEASVAWVRTTSEKWADALVAANK